MSKKLSDRLRTLRGELGITQAELAARLGVSPSTVARWEADESEPRMPFEKIAATASGAVVGRAVGAGIGAALGGVAGPVGIAAGAAMGALGGQYFVQLLRKASAMGLSTDQVADLLDPSVDPSDPSTEVDPGNARKGREKKE